MSGKILEEVLQFYLNFEKSKRTHSRNKGQLAISQQKVAEDFLMCVYSSPGT